MLDLIDLSEKLSGLLPSEVGRGLGFPGTPQVEDGTQQLLDQLFSEHEFLKRMHDYSDFIQAFAGASFGGFTKDGPGMEEDDYYAVSIYGLCSQNTILGERWTYSPLIDAQCYFGFAETNYRYEPVRATGSILDGLIDAEFSFDASGKHRDNVFVEVLPREGIAFGEGNKVFFCESFAEWLVLLLRHRGRIPTLTWMKNNSPISPQ